MIYRVCHSLEIEKVCFLQGKPRLYTLVLGSRSVAETSLFLICYALALHTLASSNIIQCLKSKFGKSEDGRATRSYRVTHWEWAKEGLWWFWGLSVPCSHPCSEPHAFQKRTSRQFTVNSYFISITKNKLQLVLSAYSVCWSRRAL